MAQWYFGVNGQQLGPVDDAVIRSMIARGELSPEVLVWREGMIQWTTAADAGLARAVAKVFSSENAAGSATAPRPGPAPLDYAAGQVAQGLPPEDPGPFQKLASSFVVPGAKWVGPAVASGVAVYLLKKRRMNQGGAHGGLLGVAVVMAVSAMVGSDDIRTCTVGELPEPARLSLDPKGKLLLKDVVVLPRQAVRRIKVTWNGMTRIWVGSDTFSVPSGIFSKKRVRKFFTDAGWKLDEELVPSMAPLHGKGFNRTFEEIVAKKSKRKTMIIAVIVIAVILIAIAAAIITNA